MQAQTTVTLYVDDRTDGAIEIDPVELAAEFVKATESGYELVRRASLEYAYRWWISGTPGRHSSWDEDEWNAIIDGLVAYLADKPEVKDRLWERVCP